MLISHLNELKNEITRSTDASSIATTVGSTVDMITSLTVALFLITSLPALSRVWATLIATGLKNCHIMRSTSQNSAQYYCFEVLLKTGISKPAPCCKIAAL